MHKVSRVFFHPECLEPAVRSWGQYMPREEAGGWDHPCHYFDGTEVTVRWIFVLDILNHCFWPDLGEPTWTVEYHGDFHSGYWGLAAALKRAMELGLPITEAAYLSQIPEADLRRIFSGQGEIPLFGARLENLREAGRVLEAEWRGDIVNLVEAAGRSAVELINQVVSSFPSFRDDAFYQGERVHFWKRAQIFANDLHLAFSGAKWGTFRDIGALTAFADYKLPQVLRAFGAISYHPELARKIDSLVNLEPGGEEEVEIRAVTIHAVEVLHEVFARSGREASSVQIDNWLWQLGQLEPFRQKPYHRCRTIFY